MYGIYNIHAPSVEFDLIREAEERHERMLISEMYNQVQDLTEAVKEQDALLIGVLMR
jgi:hypothetical protein